MNVFSMVSAKAEAGNNTYWEGSRMVKITGSKFDMYDENDTKAVTFRSCVDKILSNDEVSALGS